MSQGVFVTGTDTGCGKTEISCALMAVLQQRGLCVLGMKPVATGCEPGPGGLRNGDALRLAAQGSTPARYGDVNPYAFEPAIAPHIAAAEAGVAMDFRPILDAYARLSARSDRVVVEGVGGWRVPLGPDTDVAAMARALGLPVVLVVGLRLGCISHALLTAESIAAEGMVLAGWVGNLLDPQMARIQENICAIGERIGAPCLGLMPWRPGASAEDLAGLLDPAPLLE
jgi:dethiobiotin synthetase